MEEIEMIELDSLSEKYNNSPLDDFSGLSPKQMYNLLYDFENNELITFSQSKEMNDEIPILRLISSLISKIDLEKGIRLTPAGYLPVKVVKEIYSEKIIEDSAIENGISKLSKEFDSESIHLTKIISNLSGITRKANNRLFVTKKGKKFLESDNNLKLVLSTWGLKFNLGYLDGYENELIGQLGFGFSLFLLFKYGNTEREIKFYSDKYFKAFPNMGINNDQNSNCYRVRMFERFLKYFGIIEIRGNRSDKKLRKTGLFDKYIKFNVSEKGITHLD
jgi:hypothetical protein